MAYRTRLQTLEEPDRPQRATRFRAERSARPTCWPIFSYPLLEPSVDEFEDSSPVLAAAWTRPGAWRVLKQLFATLSKPIIPATYVRPDVEWSWLTAGGVWQRAA